MLYFLSPFGNFEVNFHKTYYRQKKNEMMYKTCIFTTQKTEMTEYYQTKKT